MAKPKLPLAEVQSLIEASSPTSLLGRWFAENREGFAATIARTRPRWEVLVVRFAEVGLIKPPTEFFDEEDTTARRQARKRAAVSARQTWHRVKSKVPADTPAPQKAAARTPTDPTVDPQTTQEPERKRPEFRTVQWPPRRDENG